MQPYYQDDSVTIYHGDCRDVLLLVPRVGLVLTDPPYGIGTDRAMHARSGTMSGHGHRRVAARTYQKTDWDVLVPQTLIDFAVSRGDHACVWGGNYYAMPQERCWLVWDKQNAGNNFADCELAWTNYGGAVRIKRHLWNGFARAGGEIRYSHPTQKPLDLVAWCISLCPGDPATVLDPFMGSGTTLRAAKDLGRKAIGIEIEERYCEIAAQRMLQEVLGL